MSALWWFFTWNNENAHLKVRSYGHVPGRGLPFGLDVRVRWSMKLTDGQTGCEHCLKREHEVKLQTKWSIFQPGLVDKSSSNSDNLNNIRACICIASYAGQQTIQIHGWRFSDPMIDIFYFYWCGYSAFCCQNNLNEQGWSCSLLRTRARNGGGWWDDACLNNITSVFNRKNWRKDV